MHLVSIAQYSKNSSNAFWSGSQFIARYDAGSQLVRSTDDAWSAVGVQ